MTTGVLFDDDQKTRFILAISVHVPRDHTDNCQVQSLIPKEHSSPEWFAYFICVLHYFLSMPISQSTIVSDHCVRQLKSVHARY
jgi:hypothetical protein